MGKFHVSEYVGITRSGSDVTSHSGDGIVPLVKEPALAEQAITFTTVQTSATFNDSTRVIRVSWDIPCHIVVGETPVADTDSKFMPVAGIEYFEVTPGDKVSVYDGIS